MARSEVTHIDHIFWLGIHIRWVNEATPTRDRCPIAGSRSCLGRSRRWHHVGGLRRGDRSGRRRHRGNGSVRRGRRRVRINDRGRLRFWSRKCWLLRNAWLRRALLVVHVAVRVARWCVERVARAATMRGVRASVGPKIGATGEIQAQGCAREAHEGGCFHGVEEDGVQEVTRMGMRT